MHAYSTGRRAVISGAGSGIGRALARQLNREGCHLCLLQLLPGLGRLGKSGP